jgi:hypothetical protein
MKVRTLCWATAALAGAAGMTLTPASAQKPAKPGKPPKPYTLPGPVSIGAKPNPVVFGSRVTVSGTVRNAVAGTTVTLLRRTLPSATFTGTATVTVDKKGNYSFVTKPPRNTYYRAVSSLKPTTQSGDLLVKVSTLVGFRVSDSTPRAGQRVRFSGTVRPRHNGRRASIQRRAGSRWITVARPTLRALNTSTSRYARTLRVRSSGTYRVRVLGHSDHAQGISRERALVTH